MNKALLMFVLLLGSMDAGLLYMCVNTEYRAVTWERRVQSAEHLQELQCNSLRAIEFGQTCLDAARTLATENGLLCERDAKLTLYVAGLDEENSRLKAVVAESVEHMETLLQENNELHDEVALLEFKIDCLEQALFMANPNNPMGPRVPPNDLSNELLDIIDIVNLADTAVTIITILL